MSKSKSLHDRRPVNQHVPVPSPLDIKGVPSEKFQFDITKCTLRRNFWCYQWEGCMRSMQCNVDPYWCLEENYLCASQRTAEETACNDSCVISIVGYHGNSVYRVVASIPIWVSCGRFLWKAPTSLLKILTMDKVQKPISLIQQPSPEPFRIFQAIWDS
jgi:hypothetical protein